MNRTFKLIFSIACISVAMLLPGCASMRTYRSDEVRIPDRAGKFPKVSKRNRLMGALTRFRNCYDVHFYSLNVDVDVDNRYINGHVDILATAVTGFDTLQIDLAKNMQLNRVAYNQKDLPFKRKQDAVFIRFPAVSAGESIEFSVYYEGHPAVAKRPPWDGGFVWEKDREGRPFIGVAVQGDGASLWWPNKDHPSEEPDSMMINVTVPGDLFCVANGQLRNISEERYGKRTYHWFVNNPINNYNVSVNIGHYVVLNDTLQYRSATRTLKHYVIDYNYAVASEYFKEVKDVIRFLEKMFGEYPWWEDGYRLVETSYLGMEHQSSIAYGNKFRNFNQRVTQTYGIYGIVDYIILHETAHEWWGNSITACDGADIWIHESFATYSEALYVETKLGYLLSVDYLLSKRRKIQNKRPIVGPRGVFYWSFEDAYVKGAWILHTLRHVINDDPLFFKILKSFATTYAKQIVCTEDFIGFVSKMTGEDYQYFFDQYLFDRKPPVIEYLQKDNRFYYRWSGVKQDFRMPLDLWVNKKNLRVYPNLETKSLNVPRNAMVEIKDWEFLVVKRENQDLSNYRITKARQQ